MGRLWCLIALFINCVKRDNKVDWYMGLISDLSRRSVAEREGSRILLIGRFGDESLCRYRFWLNDIPLSKQLVCVAGTIAIHCFLQCRQMAYLRK